MILYYKKTPVYYDSKGQGSPIVLLHGFLESSTMWTHFIPEWKTKCQLITIDLPGHGKSGVIAEIHTMELMAKVVAAILTELKIDTAAFIGHSMGGYIGLAFAELFPNQISSLLLLNSTTSKDNDTRKDNRDRALKFMKTQKDMIISMSISNLFNEDARQKFASEIEALKKEALQFSAQGITAAIKGMRDRKDRTSVLKDFNKKKYIVCGKEDTIIPFSDSVAISENTNTPLKILKGGHMSWIENCEEIINLTCLLG
jgi:pimeloyl-ACP methyl ester carboxylesterase